MCATGMHNRYNRFQGKQQNTLSSAPVPVAVPVPVPVAVPVLLVPVAVAVAVAVLLGRPLKAQE